MSHHDKHLPPFTIPIILGTLAGKPPTVKDGIRATFTAWFIILPIMGFIGLPLITLVLNILSWMLGGTETHSDTFEVLCPGSQTPYVPCPGAPNS